MCIVSTRPSVKETPRKIQSDTATGPGLQLIYWQEHTVTLPHLKTARTSYIPVEHTDARGFDRRNYFVQIKLFCPLINDGSVGAFATCIFRCERDISALSFAYFPPFEDSTHTNKGL